MTRDNKLYYEDIAEAIREIEEFMGDLSFDRFAKDTKVIRAVTMDLIAIGEAAKHVPADSRKSIQRFLGQKSWGCATS
jgi:uncharacterized protein with HEPN domain